MFDQLVQLVQLAEILNAIPPCSTDDAQDLDGIAAEMEQTVKALRSLAADARSGTYCAPPLPILLAALGGAADVDKRLRTMICELANRVEQPADAGTVVPFRRRR
jgi:hypothetical protein